MPVLRVGVPAFLDLLDHAASLGAQQRDVHASHAGSE
jgi:hypothetical protein